jgi:hypothetical protein
MNDFTLYFKTGWHHIIGWDALDHILFIVALTSIYLAENWKQVLVLVTAFTIGHSITLALSVYNIVQVNERLVEFLIPCTISATCVYNLLVKDFNRKSLRLNYIFALLFGLIHGLGFANTIRFMLAGNQQIGLPLLSFNLGLEVGQILIVCCLLLLSYIFVTHLKFGRPWWVRGLSGIALVWSFYMIAERAS